MIAFSMRQIEAAEFVRKYAADCAEAERRRLEIQAQWLLGSGYTAGELVIIDFADEPERPRIVVPKSSIIGYREPPPPPPEYTI